MTSGKAAEKRPYFKNAICFNFRIEIQNLVSLQTILTAIPQKKNIKEEDGKSQISYFTFCQKNKKYKPTHRM